jgi:superfamily II DNA or RNA helicase
MPLVRVRGARWRVAAVQPHEDCTVYTLISAEPGILPETRYVLTPFDDVDPISRRARGRRMRLRQWRRAARALFASATPAGCLRCACPARIDVLPHQLAPALSVLRGDGSRVLLADDVGLGKTVQAGLILAELLNRKCIDRALVVTPAGVRDQWIAELSERFAIDARRADAPSLRELSTALPVGVNPWTTMPVAVTSMDYVKRVEVLAVVATCRWDLLIVDEVHMVSGDSERHRAVQRLATLASFVVMLSATPHNGDDAAFEQLRVTGMASDRDDPLLVFRRTRQSVRPHAARRVRLLNVRRTPSEARMFATLARFQRAVRDEHGVSALALSVLNKRAYSSAWSLAESVNRRIVALAEGIAGTGQQLTLPLDDLEGELSIEDAPPPWPTDLSLADVNLERRLLSAVMSAAVEAALAGESKLAVLRRLLRRVREPVLIFTEFRDTATHVQSALGRGLLLHGGLPAWQRRERLSSFGSSASELLVATDAAAQGLNLQRACRLVINLELPWNPMRLEQRIGRVDRIGQKRRVHAIHLVGRETGENQILEHLHGRVARAQTAIGAPDPLRAVRSSDESGFAAAADPELNRRACEEAARILACRSLWQSSNRAALSAVEAAPWWIAKPRRLARAMLAGRAVYIFRLSIETGLGTTAASQIVGLSCEAFRAGRDREAPTPSSQFLEQWRAEANKIESEFWRRRIARERSVLKAVHEADLARPLVQPALFDRRAERASTRASSEQRELDLSLRQRLVQSERGATLGLASAQLLLVLLP